MLIDGQGLVESVITTPANCADTVVLPELIETAELTQGVSVLADKGYCSKKTQPKDSDFRGKKVQAVRRWSCAMVSDRENHYGEVLFSSQE